MLKLTYWDFPFWRAEVSRIALHLGGVEFEDYRPTRDEFLALKTSGRLPFGQLPVLEVDGQVIAQTGGIARYCGKLAGLYPTDDALAAAQIDQVIDAATDITGLFGPSMREKDREKKLALRHELAAGAIPKWLGFLEALLVDRNGSDYFVGDSLTIADLTIWRLGGWLVGGVLDGLPQDLFHSFPLLTAHHQCIDAHPEIRAWMDSHYG